MKRLPYSDAIIAMALAACRRNLNPRGVMLHTRGGRQWIARTVLNEALPISAQARSWRA